MSWDVGDVEKHRKGLTDAQKKRWCGIANSVLKKCMDGGGDESSCAASAIRQANGAMMKKDNSLVQIEIRNNEKVNVRKEVLEGQSHIVVPAVIMVEGVHAGSGGPVFYPKEELEKTAFLWNGVSVPVGHPTGEDGSPVPVGNPKHINERVVGRFFNSSFKNDRIAGEIWLNEATMTEKFPDLKTKIQNGEDVEVSASLFTAFCDDTPGVWNNEKHTGTVYGYIPDHVAIMNDQKGACGFEDGCGIRNNSEKKETLFHIVNKGGLSFDEISQMLRSQIKGKLTNPSFPADAPFIYISDVWEDRFVYEYAGKLYLQKYKVSGKNVTLSGNPTEVRREFNYVKIDNKEMNMERKEIVEKIVANAEFLKDMKLDNEPLKTLTEMPEPAFTIVQNAFNRIVGCDCQGEKKEGEKDEKLVSNEKKEDVKPVDNEKKEEKKAEPTLEQFVNSAPEELRDVLNQSVRMHKSRKSGLVKSLLANKRNKFTEAQLNNKSMDELEILVELAQIEPNMEGKNFVTSSSLKANEKQSDGTGVPDCPTVSWKD